MEAKSIYRNIDIPYSWIHGFATPASRTIMQEVSPDGQVPVGEPYGTYERRRLITTLKLPDSLLVGRDGKNYWNFTVKNGKPLEIKVILSSNRSGGRDSLPMIYSERDSNEVWASKDFMRDRFLRLGLREGGKSMRAFFCVNLPKVRVETSSLVLSGKVGKSDACGKFGPFNTGEDAQAVGDVVIEPGFVDIDASFACGYADVKARGGDPKVTDIRLMNLALGSANHDGLKVLPDLKAKRCTVDIGGWFVGKIKSAAESGVKKAVTAQVKREVDSLVAKIRNGTYLKETGFKKQLDEVRATINQGIANTWGKQKYYLKKFKNKCEQMLNRDRYTRNEAQLCKQASVKFLGYGRVPGSDPRCHSRYMRLKNGVNGWYMHECQLRHRVKIELPDGLEPPF